MSSSGLIYAVIVGAWAAYLVPMWLRRQDELNEARPTERFSTAIRLLSGRAAMERKASRSIEDDSAEQQPAQQAQPRTPPAAAPVPAPTRERAAAGAPPGAAVGPTGQAGQVGQSGPGGAAGSGAAAGPGAALNPGRPSNPAQLSHPSQPAGTAHPASAAHPGGPTQPLTGSGRRPDQRRRATLLARRRRMVILLFAVFTVGMITAAVGGIGLLWLPAIPAVLFSVYIAHLRRQERRRFEVKLDRRRAAEAAQQLRERERERRRAAAAPDTAAAPAPAAGPRPPDFAHPAGRTAAGSGVHHVQALVEAADSDDADDSDEGADESEGWSSGPRERPAGAESWDPVPVPLPTYVSAPVAPRSAGGGIDRGAPETWNPARSTAGPPPAPAAKPRRPPATPLFDQYAEETPHPRAANE